MDTARTPSFDLRFHANHQGRLWRDYYADDSPYVHDFAYWGTRSTGPDLKVEEESRL